MGYCEQAESTRETCSRDPALYIQNIQERKKERKKESFILEQ